MTYKEQIANTMEELSKHDEVVFIGQGLVTGDRVYETMLKVPTTKCIELPCAENLHIGVAIGLALKGYRPIVVFQRMDFILLAADGIINHLALMPKMSGEQFKLPVLIRTIVGPSSKRFVVGPQHNKDFSELFKPYISVQQLMKSTDVQSTYQLEYAAQEPALLVEYKDFYNA